MHAVDLTDAEYEHHIGETEEGILLVHKKLCPHCLNVRKVIEKFLGTGNGAISLMCIDSEENPEAMLALSVVRVPTLLVIKKGKVAATRVGLMNPRELAELYQNV